MQRVAIGVMVFNEAQTLGRLLENLLATTIKNTTIDPLVVVSSGSTDDSVSVAQSFCKLDPRLKVIDEKVRQGKASAINRFIASLPSGIDICVLIGADVIPDPQALEFLLKPFNNPKVGMTGARPAPSNAQKGYVNRLVHFQWSLHHQVAVCAPKLGEMVAFRNIVSALPAQTAVDEASLEAIFHQRGFELCYVPEAIVHNHGPTTLAEFLLQRRRIWAGHLWLKRQTGYEVATYRLRRLTKVFFTMLRQDIRYLPIALLAAIIESWARILGTFELLICRKNPYIWKMAKSSKKPLWEKADSSLKTSEPATSK